MNRVPTTSRRAVVLSMRGRRARAQESGFTLIELLIALTAGALVITSTYFIAGATSRNFQSQQRISQTQMAVRAAMDRLRRDVSRAGYLGTPNARADQACEQSPVPVQGVQWANSYNVTTAVGAAQATANLIDYDRLVLTGNYSTGDEYLVRSVDANGLMVYLQQGWQGYRRSFVNPSTGAFDDSLFTSAFAPGRVLRFRTVQGYNFFRVITSADPTNGTVSIDPSRALPVGQTCFGGLGDGGSVAPLSRIEYAARRTPSFNYAGTAQTGDRGAALVRREISFTTDDPTYTSFGTSAGALNGTFPEVVLDFLVDFAVDHVVDTRVVGAANPALTVVRGSTISGAHAFMGRFFARDATEAHRIRSLIVRLSARTGEVDRNFAAIDRPSEADPLTRYQFPGQTGAARVRTLTTEILLPNMAYARLP